MKTGCSSFTMTVKRYTFNNQPVLVLFDSENEPWFKSSDVSKALGFHNNRRALQKYISNNDIRVFKEFSDSIKREVGGLDWRTYFINLSGLKLLMVSAQTSKAKKTIIDLLPEKLDFEFLGMKELSN
jgi:prophage antirepressor-like protein